MNRSAKPVPTLGASGGEEAGVRSVRRAFDILSCIAECGEGALRLSEIARRTHLHKASVWRLLSTLEEIGAVRRDGKAYRLGSKIGNLAAGHGSADEVRSAGRVSLMRLADHFGDTFSLSIRSGLDAVCLDRQQGWHPIQAYALEIGGRRPLALAAAGVALISRLPDTEVAEIVHSSLRRLERSAEITSQLLWTEVLNARVEGFALLKEMIVPGMSGLGVPIRGADGGVAAALSVATITDRLSGERLDEIVREMQAEAEVVGQKIRGREPDAESSHLNEASVH